VEQLDLSTCTPAPLTAHALLQLTCGHQLLASGSLHFCYGDCHCVSQLSATVITIRDKST
jgi:hypothetical protein